MGRNQYPLNVQSETSMADTGVSINTKRSIMTFVLVALVLFITWLSNQMFKDSKFTVVATIVGFIVGVSISIFLYNHFIVNKDNDKFEDSKSNKIFKFFKLSLGLAMDENAIDGVECIRYMTGQYMLALTIAVGNISQSGESETTAFLDELLAVCHRQKVRIKMFTIRDSWASSNMRTRYLTRLTKVHDQKLKSSLASIEGHLANNVYNRSSVQKIIFNFYVSKSSMKNLKPIISWINTWKEDNLITSSLREAEWLTRRQIISTDCEYLGTKLIDISPLADKDERIVLDIRKLLKPFSSEAILSNKTIKVIEIDTESSVLRKSNFDRIKKKGVRR